MFLNIDLQSFKVFFECFDTTALLCGLKQPPFSPWAKRMGPDPRFTSCVPVLSRWLQVESARVRSYLWNDVRIVLPSIVFRETIFWFPIWLFKIYTDFGSYRLLPDSFGITVYYQTELLSMLAPPPNLHMNRAARVTYQGCAVVGSSLAIMCAPDPCVALLPMCKEVGSYFIQIVFRRLDLVIIDPNPTKF